MTEVQRRTVEERAKSLTFESLVKIERIEKRPLNECVKILHSTLFPVEYSEKFFEGIYANNYHGMNLQCVFNGLLVGVICARLEECKDDGSEKTSPGETPDIVDSRADVKNITADLEKLALTDSTKRKEIVFKCYIMTLGVLPKYRKLGLASRLLKTSMENLSAFVKRKNEVGVVQGDTKKSMRVHKVELHVQPSNDDAIQFYTNRRFCIEKTIPEYYTTIDPKTAYLLTAPFPLPEK